MRPSPFVFRWIVFISSILFSTHTFSKQQQFDVTLLTFIGNGNKLNIKNAIYDQNYDLWLFAENGIYIFNAKNNSVKQLLKASYNVHGKFAEINDVPPGNLIHRKTS